MAYKLQTFISHHSGGWKFKIRVLVRAVFQQTADLITSQEPHPQIPGHCEFGFKLWIWWIQAGWGRTQTFSPVTRKEAVLQKHFLYSLPNRIPERWYPFIIPANFVFEVFFFFFWCGPFLTSLLNLLQYCFYFVFWFFGHEASGS